MMGYFGDEVMNVSRTLKIHVSELSDDVKNRIRQELVTKFSDPECYYMWKCLKERVSIRTEEPWPWLKEFVDNTQTLILFDQGEEKAVFLVESGIDATSVLEECFRMEFYLTHLNVSYLICR